MAEAPAVAIVVVNFNSSTYVDGLLDSLEALDYAPWRLVVVDNASVDSSPERIQARIPAATIVRNSTNAGFAAAVNLGVGVALREQAGFVLLLNPDTAFGPGLAGSLVEAADHRTMVVPKVLSPAGALAGHAGGFDWRRGLQVDTNDGEPDDPALDRRREVDTGSFSCMLIPVDALRIAGPLDERLAFYYEDTDFVQRARLAGFRLLYEPAAVLRHAEGSASGGRASPFAVYYGTRNRPYVVKKHAGRLSFGFFTAYYLSTRLLRCLDLASSRQWPLLRAVLRGVRDYYQGRMGMTYSASQLAPKS